MSASRVPARLPAATRNSFRKFLTVGARGDRTSDVAASRVPVDERLAPPHILPSALTDERYGAHTELGVAHPSSNYKDKQPRPGSENPAVGLPAPLDRLYAIFPEGVFTGGGQTRPDCEVIVIGDFADPLSFLASQRAEQLRSLGLLGFRWCAVEADRLAPIGGRPLAEEMRARVGGLTLPAETLPVAPHDVPNSGAATAAYAESLTDGCADQLRRRLFDGIWVRGLQLDDPNQVRRLVAAAMSTGPLPSIEERIAANRPIVPLGDSDPIRISRRLGMTVTGAGGPLTNGGQNRIDEWRRLWQRYGAPALPLLITNLAEVRTGVDALRWLAHQLPQTSEGRGVRTAAAEGPRLTSTLAGAVR